MRHPEQFKVFGVRKYSGKLKKKRTPRAVSV